MKPRKAMPPPGYQRPSEAGVTLLELLIAMTLLGLLSIALLTSLKTGTRIWSIAEGAATDANNVRNASAELSRMIADAYPETVQGASDGHVDFQGRSDTLTFLTPDRGLPGALSRVTLAIKEVDGAQMLSLTRSLELAATGTAHRDTRILLRGVAALDLAYYGKPDKDSDPHWLTTWVNHSRLPDLVRVRVTLADARSGTWPELIVAPRVAADVNCRYDPLTKFCQGR